MILVRNIFHLKFGKARDAKALMKEGLNIITENEGNARVLTDITGPSYTMVLEIEFESLAAFESSIRSNTSQDAWQAWYQKFIPLVDRSYREILNIEQ